MRPWLGFLLVWTGLALAQEALALPPIITVKNLRAKAGPSYNWRVTNQVTTPLTGPIYPGQTGVARVTVDVERRTIPQGYVVTGKVIITNPLQNQVALEVAALKASFEPLLASPLPQPLDCPAETLQPGQSLSCSFRVDLASSAATTLTPLVLIKGMPQLQGAPMALSWPSAEDKQLPTGKVVEAESSCALVQTQVAAGELARMVRVSTATVFEDMLQAGLEVCDEKTSLAYDITVGPFDESSGLCGSYMIKDAPAVRLAAGSMGSSSSLPTSLQVTLGGCRQRDVLGGHKPAVAISKLTMSKLTTHEWTAEPVSSTNTSSPATLKYDTQHAVDVAVRMQRTLGKTELLMSGEVTLTNTERLPYILKNQGVRLQLSKQQTGAAEKLDVSVSCPMVGANVVVPPMLGDKPGTLLCEFKTPIDAAWKKGFVQAQLQTLLSATFEVDSGLPQPFDFDDTASVQNLYQGECVDVHLTRVTNPADLASAHANPEVANLARKMGGDKFKLVPMSTAASGTVPPAAGDSSARPLVVCNSQTVTWQETYGPFTQNDCGPNMALMGVSVKPTSGPSTPISATLAFPMAVKECMIKPEIKPVSINPFNTEVYNWTVAQTREPAGIVSVHRQKAVPITYTVDYKRSASLSGFKVAGLFKVTNPHHAPLDLDEVSFAISRPNGQPVTGEAACSGTLDEGSEVTTAAATAAAAGSTQAALSSSSSSSGGQAGGPGALTRPAKRIKMAAVKRVKHHSSRAAAAASVAEGEHDVAEVEYEDGGHGPLFCSFEAHLPDDYPGEVQLIAATSEGAQVVEKLGVINWSQAKTSQENECALASFAFSSESTTLVKPSSIDGDAPPALALRLCEDKRYSFRASLGPWAQHTPCGPREALSIATVSLPNTATVLNKEDKVSLEVTGCPEPLPTLTIDASQQPVKETFVWSVVRRMAPITGGKKHPEDVVTVAGPGSPKPEASVLALAARHNAGSKGAYAKFNQTIVVKRTKQSYAGTDPRFEVKGEIRVANNADMPLRLKSVQVKIQCESGEQKAIVVKATCPEHCYDSDFSHAEGKEQTFLTIPTTASSANPIKCHFGAVVPGPKPVAIHGVAVMADGRKAKAKHSVHLELRSDFFKLSSLGSCLRVKEARQVTEAPSGKGAQALLTTTGNSLPEESVEVCKSHVWSTIARVGPLEEGAEGQAGQAVTYKSYVEAVPSSGYQHALKNEGVVEVHAKASKHGEGEEDGSEDHSKTYKGSDFSKHRSEHLEEYDKGGSEHWKTGYTPGKGHKSHKGGSKDSFGKDSSSWAPMPHSDAFPPLPGSGGGTWNNNNYAGGDKKGQGFPPLPGSGGGGSDYAGNSKHGMPPLPGSSGGGSSRDYVGGGGSNHGMPPLPGSGSGSYPAVPPLPGSSGGGGSDYNGGSTPKPVAPYPDDDGNGYDEDSNQPAPPLPGSGGDDDDNYKGGSSTPAPQEQYPDKDDSEYDAGSSNPSVPPLPGSGDGSYKGGSSTPTPQVPYPDKDDSEYDAGSNPSVPPLPGSGGGGDSNYKGGSSTPAPYKPEPDADYSTGSNPTMPPLPGAGGPDSSYGGGGGGRGGNTPMPPLPGADAGGDYTPGSTPGPSSSNSPSEWYKDDMKGDGEGGGEGYDDNQKADFWKGSSKARRIHHGFGGVGEKLVTSSLAPKAASKAAGANLDRGKAKAAAKRGAEPSTGGIAAANSPAAAAATAVAAAAASRAKPAVAAPAAVKPAAVSPAAAAAAATAAAAPTAAAPTKSQIKVQ